MAKLQDLKTRQRQAAAGVPAAPATDPLTSKRELLAARREMLTSGASSAVNVAAEIQTALKLAEQNASIRSSTDDSFLEAVRTALASGLGLSDGYGFLSAEKRECKFIPGWKGLVDLVLRSERGSVWTGVVYKGDFFDYQLGDRPHVTQRRGDSDEPNDITHFYAVGRIKGSDTPIVEVWTISKLNRHFQRHNNQGEDHYALKSHEAWESYGRKLALLQVLKFMPKSRDLEIALAADAAAFAASAPAPAPVEPPRPAPAPAEPAPIEPAAAPAADPAPATKPARKPAAKKAAAPRKTAAKPAPKKATKKAPESFNME